MPRHPIESAVIAASRGTTPWLICVSGGADSMALLHACRRAGVPGVAAHCNFGLRGEESMRDERFVRDTCESLGIPLRVIRFDTEAHCKAHGLSLEMGCRELRYDWFRALMRELRPSRIAVAHNADDDTETMLLNLLRGTGVRGLTGMSPDNEEIIRPLLSFSRAEIQEYMQGIGAKWITDSSNLTSDFKRNFLRNEILPALRTRWPGLGKTLARTRSHLAETAALADIALKEALKDSTPSRLPSSSLEASPAPAALIHAWLDGRGASPTQIADMAGASPGARWQLSCGAVEKTARGLRFTPAEKTSAATSLTIERIANTEAARQEIRANPSHDILYCAPAPGLHLRPALPGERFSPFGMRGSMPVAKALKEAGTPLAERSRFLLLADGTDRVVWLPGIKRSGLYTVTSEASHILRITLNHES